MVSSARLHGQAEEFEHSLALMQATFDAIAQGILAVDVRGKAAAYNRPFLQMWRIPEEIAEMHDDERLLGCVMEQLKDPQAFLDKMQAVYAQPEAEIHDLLDLQDGRVFERFSQPLRLDGEIAGWVWSFIDATEQAKTEQALRQSEEYYRALITSASDIITILNGDGTVRYESPSFERVFGYPVDEAVGKLAFEFVHPDDVSKVMEYFATGLSQPESKISAIYRFRHKDGSWRVVESVGINLLSHAAVKGIVVNTRDVTESKRLEKELRQANDVIENSPVVLFRWKAEPGWPVELVTQNVSQFGYSAEDFLTGRVPYASIIHPDDVERVGREVEEYTARGISHYRQEYRIVTRFGDVRWTDDRTVVERDAEGRPLYYQGIVMDITERKRAEEALRDNEERYRMIAENVSDVIMVTDADSRYTYISPAGKALFGCEPEQLIGEFSPDSMHPDDLKRLMTEAQEHGAQEALTTTMRIRRVDGSYIWCESSARMLRDPKTNEMAGYISVMRDISERKQQESELRLYQMLVDNSLDGIAIGSPGGRLLYGNASFKQMMGASGVQVYMNLLDCFDKESCQQMESVVRPTTMQTGRWQGRLTYKRVDGSTFIGESSALILKDDNDVPVAQAIVLRDITEQLAQQAERERLQQQVIDAQRQALQELSTPIIPIMEGIIVMPLVGAIDSMRSRDVMRALLSGINQYRAQVAIIDITGVPLVDSGVADHLNRTIQAARLKGVQTIVTGISDAVAETIVDLGIDWDEIETLRSLQTGLMNALHRLGFRLEQRSTNGSQGSQGKRA